MKFRSILLRSGPLTTAFWRAWQAARVLCAMLGFCLELMLRIADGLCRLAALLCRGLAKLCQRGAERVYAMALMALG